jgi:hypothetical protein
LGKSEHDLVRLTSCGNPVEAGALREYLEANGVQAFVQGEHHSSMLGQMGSFLIDLNVLVQQRQLGEAQGLLEAFENAEPLDEDDGSYDDDDGGGLIELDPNPPRAELRVGRVGRRPKIAALLALVPSFGFAHFYTGAFIRGFILAAVETAGILLLATNLTLGIGLIALAIFVDLAAGSTRAGELAAREPPELPAARAIERDD